jgi:hypothetical protein
MIPQKNNYVKAKNFFLKKIRTIGGGVSKCPNFYKSLPDLLSGVRGNFDYIIMGRPRKNIKEHELNGTAFPSRIKKIKETKDDRFSIIRNKLLETEKIISDLPIKDNAKILIEYVNLYKKLIEILETDLPAEKNNNETDIIDKILNK